MAITEASVHATLAVADPERAMAWYADRLGWEPLPISEVAGTLIYKVVAYDTNPADGTPREGDWSDELTVVEDNTPPHPPTDLTVSRAADGSVTLTWRRPSPEDPDAGDRVEFYRVYRDGKELANRYARWFDDAATVTWRDLATGGSTHTYWVRAVDERYAESDLLGPVIG